MVGNKYWIQHSPRRAACVVAAAMVYMYMLAYFNTWYITRIKYGDCCSVNEIPEEKIIGSKTLTYHRNFIRSLQNIGNDNIIVCSDYSQTIFG